MAETLKFDESCTTPEKKTGFAYRAQEVLQLEHNIIGKWFREGITQAEYDQLAQSKKDAFPYTTNHLSKKDCRKYQNEMHEPKSQIIIKGITDNRQLLKDSIAWDIDLDKLTETK